MTCEEFVEELLDRGYAVETIKHEGVDMQRAQFDKIVRNAASQLAARKIRASLNIKAEEEKFRFGFAA